MSESVNGNKHPLVVLLAVYFLSGIVSLSYEVLWIKMLALQFGVSIFGVVITVSAFMCGLGLGSLSFSRKCYSVKRPLLVYACLEFLIALMTVSIPEVYQWNQTEFSALAINTSLLAWSGIQMAFAFLVLFIPAYLMGAGFSFILRAIEARYERVAWFYGLNAAGAALGALLPLLLIPLLGWLNALFVIAGMGFVIALVSLILALNKSIATNQSSENLNSKISLKILLHYAAVGMLSMILQVAWTRLFGMLLLRTEYIAALIICIFVLGIGLGSLLSQRLHHPKWLMWIPLFIGLYSVLGLWVTPYLNSWSTLPSDSWAYSMLVKALLVTGLALPVTMALGAWFPLLTKNFHNTDFSATRLYSVNSLGAGLGAALTGFVLLPYLGATTSIVVAATFFILLAGGMVANPYRWPAFAIVIMLSLPVYSLKPVAVLLPAAYANSSDLFVSEDAISLTHVVQTENGQRMLLSDLQRMDASTDLASVESQRNQLRLPLLLHPNPHRVLLLGLGTGITASAAANLPNVQVSAVEISRGAINAAKTYFIESNLGMPSKMVIINDDARHYLISGTSRYDIIVGDLFHPDLVGRSSLLSLQQFERVKARLNDDGVFVQWLALNQFDIGSLDIMLRTFNRVFPKSHVFMDGFRVALVGMNSQYQSVFAQAMSHPELNQTQYQQLSGGEGKWTWLGRYGFPIQASSGPVQDEWKPQIEYRLPIARFDGSIDLLGCIKFIQDQRIHVDKAAELLGVAADKREFENAFIANSLSYRSWMASLGGQEAEAIRLLQLSYQANKLDRWVGFSLADRIYTQVGELDPKQKKPVLEGVLSIRSDHVQALKDLYEMESLSGDAESALKYLTRIKSLSPLERIKKNHVLIK